MPGSQQQPRQRGLAHRGGYLVAVALLVVVAACTGSAATPSADPSATSPDMGVATTSIPDPGLPTVPRISVFGDSTALMTSWGLLTELERTHRAEFVVGFTGLGCSVLRTDERRIADDVAVDDPTCNDWANVWKSHIDTDQPDIAVVQTGSWDVADRKLPGRTNGAVRAIRNSTPSRLRR